MVIHGKQNTNISIRWIEKDIARINKITWKYFTRLGAFWNRIKDLASVVTI